MREQEQMKNIGTVYRERSWSLCMDVEVVLRLPKI